MVEVAAAAILAVAAFALLRHLGFVALAAAAIVPGCVLTWALFPQHALAVASYTVLPTYTLACVLAWRGAQAIAQSDAARRGSLLLSFGTVAVSLVFVPFALVAVAAASGIFALLLMRFVAPLLPMGEDFVTRTNRLHETRLRLFAHLSFVTQSRWGWSVSGIAAVFMALVYFRAPPPWSAITLLQVLPAAALLLAALAAVRDWRRGLSTGLSLLPVWLLAHGTAATAIGAVAIYAIAATRPTGEASAGSMRALERDGPAVVCATMACALVLMLGSQWWTVLGVLVGGACALLLPAAFAAVLDGVFPRAETVAARYRVY